MNMPNSMNLAILMMTIGLTGCGERSPVVRACMTTIGADTGSPAAERCRCIDGIARQQLDPKAYMALEQVALATEREGQRSVITGGFAASEKAAHFIAQMNATERTIVVGDAAFIAVKAAARCRS